MVETSDENGGANLGYTEVGEWLEYTVTIIGGEYELDLRHASGGTGGSFRLDCDGDDVSGVIDLAGTGGWQTWETHTAPGITLPAGEHVLRLTVLSSGSNLNWLALREVGSDAVRTIIMDHVDGYMWSSIPGSTSVEGPSTSTFADLDPTADHLLTPVPASNN